MTKFAKLPSRERDLFFRQYQAQFGVDPVIAEKDFWVCWLLKLISETEPLAGHYVFKGGTSLSKVFQAIDRFSEDVDLSLSPALLGWDEDIFNRAGSRTQFTKLGKKLEEACAEMLEATIVPALETAASEVLGYPPAAASWFQFELDAATHSPVIQFRYPIERSGMVSGYIPRQVKLEFGSLTDQKPVGSHEIVAMIDSLAEGRFSDARTTVVALELERTFWEKATILHAEFHRPGERSRERFSRHYSDFAALWKHDKGPAAAARLDLLEKVRVHKSRFFASAWAHYHTASPGTFRLVPPKRQIPMLRADYQAMRQMFLSEPRPFDDILMILDEAERSLNV